MNELRLIAHEGKHGIIYWQAADRQQVNAAMRLAVRHARRARLL